MSQVDEAMKFDNFNNPIKMGALLQGFVDAQKNPLPHALAFGGVLKLSGKHITERVNAYLLKDEQVSVSIVGKALTALGFKKKKGTQGSRPMVVVWNEGLMQHLLAELAVIDASWPEDDLPVEYDVPKLPRFRKLADMPLSDEQREIVAEWLDYQLALFREFLING